MNPEQWPEAAAVIMLVLNQLPSPSLGNIAPVTAMSGRPAMKMADRLALPGSIKAATLEEVAASQMKAFEAARTALDAMHKEMSAVNAKKRDAARRARAKKLGVQMAQFEVGDYVLYQDVWQYKAAKLKTTWCGPAAVVAVLSNWVYEIRNLLTTDVRTVHASRLKFYADSSLRVTGELLDHVAHNADGYEVEAIEDARYDAAKKAYEVKIKWRGLQDLESSW
jgi:hypothetical protein